MGMFCSQIEYRTPDASLCCSCVCLLMQLVASRDFLNLGYYLGWSTQLALPLGEHAHQDTKVTFLLFCVFSFITDTDNCFLRVKCYESIHNTTWYCALQHKYASVLMWLWSQMIWIKCKFSFCCTILELSQKAVFITAFMPVRCSSIARSRHISCFLVV